MSFSNTKNELYKFFVIAFDAAPGMTYLSQMADAVNSGMSVQQVVNVFTHKPQFTSVYPNNLSNTAFAASLITNVVGDSASQAAITEAVADVVAGLESGMSRGDVIYQVFSNLSSAGLDSKYAGVAQLLANKVALAQYYTEKTLGDSTSLPFLQSVLHTVTEDTDTSSAAALQRELDKALDAHAPTLAAQSFSYTEGRVTGEVVGSITTAADDVGVTDFQIVSGNDAGYFAVDHSGNITLTAAGALLSSASNNFDVSPNQFELGVVAKDGVGNVSSTATFVLHVLDNVGNMPVISAVDSANEGTAVAVHFTGGNPLTTYVYGLSGANITSSDIVGGKLGDFFITDAQGNATITLDIANDRLTEGENPESLLVTVSGAGITLNKTIQIVDTSQNNVAPVAADLTVAVDEGHQVTGQLSSTDANGDVITYTLKNGPVAGLTLHADGSFTFDEAAYAAGNPRFNPAPDAVGHLSFEVVASDTLLTDTANLNIDVTGAPLTYSLTANHGFVHEGGTVTYTVTASEAVPEDTDVVFFLSPSGATSASAADFSGVKNAVLTIQAGHTTATFDVHAALDLIDELPEGYTVSAVIDGNTYNLGETLTSSGLILEVGAAEPTYVVTTAANVDETTAGEGTDITFTLQTTNLVAGTVVHYKLTGMSAADFDAGYPAGGVGTFVVDADGEATLGLTLKADHLTEGTENLTLTLLDGDAGVSATTHVHDTSLTPGKTYEIEASAVSVAEADANGDGNSVTFTLHTTNVAAGTVLSYKLVGLSAADFESGYPTGGTGTFVVDGDGNATTTLVLKADHLTEGTENLTLQLVGHPEATDTVAILDNSVTLVKTYEVTASSETVDEVDAHGQGNSVTFTLHTENVAAGTVLSYTLSGMSAADFESGYPSNGSGTFVVDADGNATVTLGLKADKLAEGEETLTLSLTGHPEATASVDIIDNSTDNGQVFELTPGVDDTTNGFMLGSKGTANINGDDIFNALPGALGSNVVSTLTDNDVIDGGAGNDTLNIHVNEPNASFDLSLFLFRGEYGGSGDSGDFSGGGLSFGANWDVNPVNTHQGGTVENVETINIFNPEFIDDLSGPQHAGLGNLAAELIAHPFIFGVNQGHVEADRFVGAKEIWQINQAIDVVDAKAGVVVGFQDINPNTNLWGDPTVTFSETEGAIGLRDVDSGFRVNVEGDLIDTLDVSGTLIGADVPLKALVGELSSLAESIGIDVCDSINMAEFQLGGQEDGSSPDSLSQLKTLTLEFTNDSDKSEHTTHVMLEDFTTSVSGSSFLDGAFAHLETIDASASTVGLVLDISEEYSGEDGDDMFHLSTVKTGTGDDILALSQNVFKAKEVTIDTNDGNDWLLLGSGDFSSAESTNFDINTGAGNDIVVLTKVEGNIVTIDLGEGDDTLVLDPYSTTPLEATHGVTSDLVKGGEGFDTLVLAGNASAAEDGLYDMLLSHVQDFDAIEFLSSEGSGGSGGFALDADRLYDANDESHSFTHLSFSDTSYVENVHSEQTLEIRDGGVLHAWALDYTLTASGDTSDYGDDLHINASGLDTCGAEVNAYGNHLTLDVDAYDGDLCSGDSVGDTEYSLYGDVKEATVVLHNGTAIEFTGEEVQTFAGIYVDAGDGDLMGLTKLTLEGDGWADVFNSGDAALTTIDARGLHGTFHDHYELSSSDDFYYVNASGSNATFHAGDASWGLRYETENAKQETIILADQTGGADWITFDSGSSTYGDRGNKIDTVENLHFEWASDNSAQLTLDSDGIEVADITNFKSYGNRTTDGSLATVLDHAAALADNSLVFQYESDYYVFVDNSQNNVGTVESSDTVIKLTGVVVEGTGLSALDAIIASLNTTHV